MNPVTVLLVLYVLNGEAVTLAVVAPSEAACEVMETEVTKHLVQMAGGKPQLYAAHCATVLPFGDDL